MWSSPKCTGETHAGVSTHWDTGTIQLKILINIHTGWEKHPYINTKSTSIYQLAFKNKEKGSKGFQSGACVMEITQRWSIVRHPNLSLLLKSWREFTIEDNSHSPKPPPSLMKGQWWHHLHETKTITILDTTWSTQVWQRKSTGKSNGLLGALKQLWKQQTHTHIHRKCEKRECVSREDAGHTYRSSLHVHDKQDRPEGCFAGHALYSHK